MGRSTGVATVADANYQGSATGTLAIVDTTAPVIQSLTASPNVLWSPNHRMVPVGLSAAVTDTVDAAPVTRIVAVSSNEPQAGLAADDVGPDWDITGALTLNLRAERWSVSGRVYTITLESRDAAGNAARRTVTVTVPHNQ